MAQQQICLQPRGAWLARHRQTMVRCIDVSKIEMLLIMLVPWNVKSMFEEVEIDDFC